MLMLAVETTSIAIDPSGILAMVPAWLITIMWVITTVAFAANTTASAYKRAMEGRAAVMNADRNVCTQDECPYRQHWIESKRLETDRKPITKNQDKS
jgi:hypothetical protein